MKLSGRDSVIKVTERGRLSIIPEAVDFPNPKRAIDPEKLVEKVAIVGAGGRTGRALVEFFGKREIELLLFDRRSPESLREKFAELEQYSPFYSWAGSRDSLPEADLVISSPGVPPDNELIQLAHRQGIPVVSELELAYHFCPARIAAVTGTNGKTTTTRLTARLLETGLKDKVVLAGNIGRPAISAIEEVTAGDWLVLEVSSFQLAACRDFRPDIAIFINFTADHLDWHGTLEDYREAKGRIFLNQTWEDLALINLDDPEVRRLAGEAAARIMGVSGQPDSGAEAIINDEALRIFWKRSANKMASLGDIKYTEKNGEVLTISAEDMKLKGEHNKINVALAILAARELGVSSAAIKEVVRDFEADPHRLEIFYSAAGLLLIDDSKATNPPAAVEALKTYGDQRRGVIIIAGGQDRGQDNKAFAREIARRAGGAVLLGETAGELAEQLEALDYHRFIEVESMAEAARQGLNLLEEREMEGLLLLSPGAPSWDMFSSYKERGRLFQEACQNYLARE